MNLFNFNHFWITQSELCLNGTIVTASFVFVTIFLDTYENPRRKNFIKPSCPKHPQIINLKKKWHKFLYSHFFASLWCLNNVSSFWGTTKRCENKKIMLFFPLYSGLGRQGLRLRLCQTPNLRHFRFLNSKDA